MNLDPTGHFVITLTALITAAIIGASLGAVAGGVYGGITAAKNHQNIFAGIVFGAIGGAIMGAGAAVGGLFLAPVLAGSSIMFSTVAGAGFFMGTAVSTGLALAIGIGVPLATGLIAGAFMEIGNQMVNNKGKVNDWGAVGLSALQNGILNVANAFLCGGAESMFIRSMSLGFPVATALSMSITILFNGVISVADYFINKLKKVLANQTAYSNQTLNMLSYSY